MLLHTCSSYLSWPTNLLPVGSGLVCLSAAGCCFCLHSSLPSVCLPGATVAAADWLGLAELLAAMLGSGASRPTMTWPRPRVPQPPPPPPPPSLLPPEQDLKARTKLAVSGQFDALNLNKAPKFGFGYNIAY